jgi:methionyl-tRNA synthetase
MTRTANQYGDSCDKCGATYSPGDLIEPVSTLSGATPEQRTAKHLFVQLEKLHEFLGYWTQTGEHLQVEVANYLKGHFLGEPLRDWDVSRPAPYFGFEIPDSPGNYWYVWFDAPVGYMASLAEWCARHGEQFDQWWPRGADAESRGPEIHQFIGNDITYFHTLFWPGMLKAAGFKLPTKVHIHGFLTVGGEKMSKSKGTFVQASTYLDYLDPAALRYYYATKLGPRLDDLDLNLDEFVEKVNADLVGKLVNIASRCARFVQSTGLSRTYPDDGGLFARAAEAGREIADAYESCDYSRAMRLIMELADRANAYIDARRPWVVAKETGRELELQEICSVGLNVFRQLVVYLAPVLPRLAEQTGALLGQSITSWSQSQQPLTGTPVAAFSHLMRRIDRKDVDAMIEQSKEPEGTGVAAQAPPPPAANAYGETDEALRAEPLAATCSIDDFARVDLRVARVLAAEEVPGADKLLKLTVNLGGDVSRTVFAGIKQAYRPEQLVGRLVVVVANLAPRKMKFGLSEGMVVASGPGGADVFLLGVDSGAKPGQRVH